MQKITSADQRKLSIFVKELYGLDSVQRILERMVHGLGDLIGSESVFVAKADPKRNMVSLLADNIGPELRKHWPTLVALRHENPAINYHMSRPEAPALMIKDLFPMSQWRRTTVFNEFYSRLGMQERLSLSLSFSRPDVTGVVAHRSRGSFTERDRSVLNLLRLHVSQACNAARRAGFRVSLGAWRWNRWSARASLRWMVAEGSVLSSLAQRHRELHPGEGRFQDRHLSRTGFSIELSSDDLGIRPPQPLLIRRGERTLHIRIARIGEGEGFVLLLRAEDPMFELAKLSILGLGARSTEVLYWLAKGKTNKEISVILSMATETVKTHLKMIFSRLAIENRATAALMICELLVGT
jgi:DNA-binding CsgD family transcriptional regulator